ncbi:MAG: HAD family hydrolase [Prolixibacteraceae bacterium]|nr:HAD family hydrolase [Prolixibacteraceae bacterium]
MEAKSIIEKIRNKSGFICDMDGVIYHGNRILDGVLEFVTWLKEENKKFVFLTNSSAKTIKELQGKLLLMGIDVGPEHFYTSALATAAFLQSQKPNGSAYIIGDAGLTNALYNVGYSSNNVDPDYVVLGETRSYNFEVIEKAVNLVLKGAKLVGTNPDLSGPIENGITPAAKALIAPIELATGKQAYFVGKPNPLMMRIALRKLGVQREDAIIIGDRMDTDIAAGIEAEIDTCLVLSGISTAETVKEFAFRPHFVLQGVNEIVKDYK